MSTEPERPSLSSRRTAVVAGAVVVGASAWVGSEFVNGVNVWSPGPLLMIVPAWLIGQAVLGDIDAGPQLIPFLGAVWFLVLAIPVMSARSTVVWPALTFIGALITASVVFFIGSWSYGLEYQGRSYTLSLLALNVVCAVLSAWLALRAKRTRAYWIRYAATLFPCVWFVWLAFPWLGEMP